MAATVLTINGGSSSIKFALFEIGDSPRPLMSGKVNRIGFGKAEFTATSADAQLQLRQQIEVPDHKQAVGWLIEELGNHVGLQDVAAIGHRVVHGGTRYTDAQAITKQMVDELRRLTPLAPNHLPAEIAIIEALTQRFPGVSQVACFDTGFHHDLPRVAQLLPLPRRYEAAGVRRYGFHGLSYTFLMEKLAQVAGLAIAHGRVILAHLGAGASMAAVHGGKCIDTSMSFTPTAGLVMATRSGDLDPGVLIYLMRSEGLTADQVDELVNHRSGLLGISDASPDMRDLLGRMASDPRATDAVEVFCYQARKWIGAFAAALGGLDTIVFSGGIGENAPDIRNRICGGLSFLAFDLDHDRNQANAMKISTETSQSNVWVIPTDEELMIANTVCRLLTKPGNKY